MLRCRIKAIFKEHKSKYGSRRILEQLESEGHQIGRYKVRRLMRNLGLKAKFPRKYKVTTDSKHNLRLSDYRFVTRRSAQLEVIDYISYYNSIRLHSTLGYKTPFDYEKELCRIAA